MLLSDAWKAKLTGRARLYLSMKPLSSWTKDLTNRCTFFSRWVETGHPIAVWVSTFFFPQAFLTATLQNYARRVTIAIDLLSFDFGIWDDIHWEGIGHKAKEAPETGCYG